MVICLQRQIRWLSSGQEVNPWVRWHPIRPFVHWYSSLRIKQYLDRKLESHLAEVQDRQSTTRKSMISLAMQAYVEE